MDPEFNPTALQNPDPARLTPDQSKPPSATVHAPHDRDVFWALAGPHGLRSGWSAIFFIALYYLFIPVLGTIAVTIDPDLANSGFAPVRVVVAESIPLLSILGAGLFLARVEHRRLSDYNLAADGWIRRFFAGALAGFAGLSVLIGVLALGGWLRFGHSSLAGLHVLKYGAFWAVAFLLVGFFEEGSFRCFLQFTLARGINFWWALAAVGGICFLAFKLSSPACVRGVYAVALLGFLACFGLHLARVSGSAFWHAAWVTSTAFGAYHTANPGENSIGIFAAAFIGFVFCVSVRLTGSAWWAIGCHAAWDWSETFFYGTADSGFAAQSHLLATQPAGNPLWSGGADGPEGSLLVVPVALLLIAFLVVAYGRGKSVAPSVAAREQLVS